MHNQASKIEKKKKKKEIVINSNLKKRITIDLICKNSETAEIKINKFTVNKKTQKNYLYCPASYFSLRHI